MEIIESRNNNKIKDIKKLKERKWRKKLDKFIVEGFRFVQELLDSGIEYDYIVVNHDYYNKYEELKEEFSIEYKKEIVVTGEVFKELAETQNSQGILAVVPKLKCSRDVNDGLYVLLDRLQDPGNVGTIIRTAHAAGAKGIILMKGCVDIFNDKVLRSTMGSIFKIPIIEDFDMEFTKELKEAGFKVLVSSLEDSKDFYHCDLKGNFVIAVGNEGNGLSDELYDIGDVKAKIPMPGGAESLNAGVAASIMIYEYVRQKNN